MADDGCRKLLGITSVGRRIVCGRPTARSFADRCPSHEKFATPCSVTVEIDVELAEVLHARAVAYGRQFGELVGEMLRAGVVMGLDAKQ
jgi:hypothetical protein